MLLIVLVLLWGAFLVPTVVRKVRDWRNDQSIEHFHLEHDLLARRAAVAPLHRLDERDEYERFDDVAYAGGYGVPERVEVSERHYPRAERPRVDARPRLTVVHDDDTYQSIESRGSWDEWAADYEFDEPRTRRAQATGERVSLSRPPVNRYAAAYSSTPSTSRVAREAPETRRRSMRARRRVVFTRLVLAAVVFTVAAVFVGYSFVWDLAIVAWIGVVSFVALALYAVGQGYLHESSLGLGRARGRSLATVEPLDRHRAEESWRGEPEFGDYERDDGYDPRHRAFADVASGRSGREARFDRYALG